MTGSKLWSRVSLLTSLLLTTLFSTANAVVPLVSTSNTSVASSSYEGSSNNVKVAINVPEGDQKTDLYFAFEAPSDYEWVGFGMGMVMDNSLMFVVYRSADNQGEPTVSPRVGTGHVMPEWYNGTVVNVLEGSEVTDDKFVVNLHCKSCRQWGDGSLDTSSTRGRFFYAFGPKGGDLKSDNYNERIETHPSHPKQFNLNVAAAIGVNGVPAFGVADSTDGDNSLFGGVLPLRSAGLAFHALFMTFAFTIVFPLGYLFVKIFDRIWLHWGTQVFGTLLTLIGAVVGLRIAVVMLNFPKNYNAHEIIGIIAVGSTVIAMILGGVGHTMYKRKGVPSPLMKVHRYAGPFAIGLGFGAAVTGLSYNDRGPLLYGYIAVDLIIWIVIILIVYMKQRKDRKKSAANTAAARNFREASAYTHVRGGSMPHVQYKPALHYEEQEVPHSQYRSNTRYDEREVHVPLQQRTHAVS